MKPPICLSVDGRVTEVREVHLAKAFVIEVTPSGITMEVREVQRLKFIISLRVEGRVTEVRDVQL